MFQNFKLRRGLTTISLGAMLAGCGGSFPLSAPGASVGAVPQARAHQLPERSWMAPTASGQDLLYVSEGGENVYVYTYPQGHLVGTLTGFIYALGECVDSAGDVFIVTQTNSSSSSSVIYEYAHGGTQPIATLKDPTGGEGCAINPTSGDLAVAGGYMSGSSAYGDVAIYPDAQGSPSMYYSSTFLPFHLCGYDAKSDLYVSATDFYSGVEELLVRLSARSSVFEQVTLNVTLYAVDPFPSSVQWDGSYMTVSSASQGVGGGTDGPAYLYRLRISGSTATVVGTTTLSSRKNRLKSGQIRIEDRRVLGADYSRKASGGVDSWSYPNAAKARTVVPHTVNLSPFGVAVSPAVSRRGTFSLQGFLR